LNDQGVWVNQQAPAGRGRGEGRGRGRGHWRGRGRGRGNRAPPTTDQGSDEDDDVILIEDDDPVLDENHRVVPRRSHVVIEEVVDVEMEDRWLLEQAILLDPPSGTSSMTASAAGGHGFRANTNAIRCTTVIFDGDRSVPLDVVAQLFEPWQL
jgi:hypothetical protein